MKTKLSSIAEVGLGFESGHNKSTLRKNRQLAEDLKEGFGYCYKGFSPVLAERTGIYKAKIIQQAVNQVWFTNRRDEGATHPDLFGPVFPKPAFALILTGIECCVDEWATGVKTPVPFTSADYRSVYLDHLNALDAFEEGTAPRNILGDILKRTHDIGRFHSGAQPLAPQASTAVLSQAALDAAIREYDEGRTGSDDEDEADA
ncbi:hypothetical protein R3P38DRAFT_3552461 [Favolaschia claudopus]|uniref:DUF6532 domain-containing protein n=1 Tax=Favolaschia claudopus TaxID=2862362 RepID=A0AAW0B268_9AGAR